MPTGRDGAVDRCAAEREKSESCHLLVARCNTQKQLASKISTRGYFIRWLQPKYDPLPSALLRLVSMRRVPQLAILLAIVLTGVECDQSKTAAIQVFWVEVEQLRFWPEPAFIAGYPIRAANYPSFEGLSSSGP
jgi:hypothetical protein